MAVRTFRDRVAVVTGAGSGIGQALACQLAGRGCDLALVDISGEGLRETRERVADSGREISLHTADVSDRFAMADLADDVVAAHGKVNLLFNNAGITYARTFEGHSLDDWERIIGINLWGCIHGCHFFLPHLKKQAGDAHIVNLSSMVAFAGPPQQTSYTATKSAIKGFSESLWAELHGEGIGVTVALPGAIKTHIMDEALKTAEDPELFSRTKNLVDKMAMPVDKAVKKILKAVSKDRMRVVIGADARFLEGAKRSAPDQIHKLFLLQPKK
jgi:short-subunit dehydrogenase